jgi:hypothetical protein
MLLPVRVCCFDEFFLIIVTSRRVLLRLQQVERSLYAEQRTFFFNFAEAIYLISAKEI